MTIRTEDSGDKLLEGVRAKNVGIVREALQEGYDPNQADQDGWTAFHEAVSTGNSSITLAFLRRGACPDLQDGVNQDSALHIAAMDGQTKIVQILLDNGANISLKNIEGKTAEDVASSACKELLQRKRIQLLMTTSPDKSTKSYKDGSLLKLNPERSASPKTKQVATSHRLPSSDYSDSPSPGEIKLSFEYYTKNVCLKVNILEVKDLKLPTVHNYSHLYVKCCLIPDKDKETKGKTSSFKLDSEDQGYASRGSSASSQSSTGSYSSIDSDVIAEKIMSVLKKRPHMGSRKNKNEGEETTGRVSFSIYESLSYDAVVLRKLNSIMQDCQVYVRVCGKNRWTSKGSTIAEATIPLAIALKRTKTAQSFCLNYKIDVPMTPEERKVVQMNQSWEVNEERQYTGRSVAWNMAEPTQPTQPQAMYKTASVPDFSSSKKHRKHSSKASRFLKGDLKIFKGKQNDRYKKSGKQMTENPPLSMENPACSDEVEYIGPDLDSSVCYNTTMDRQISEHWNVGKSVDNIFEVTKVLEEPTAPQPSLKYSRAFGEQRYTRRARQSHDKDVSIEDVDDDFEEELSQTTTRPRVSRR